MPGHYRDLVFASIHGPVAEIVREALARINGKVDGNGWVVVVHATGLILAREKKKAEADGVACLGSGPETLRGIGLAKLHKILDDPLQLKMGGRKNEVGKKLKKIAEGKYDANRRNNNMTHSKTVTGVGLLFHRASQE